MAGNETLTSDAIVPATADHVRALGDVTNLIAEGWRIDPSCYPSTLASHAGLDGQTSILRSPAGATFVRKQYTADTGVDFDAAAGAYVQAAALGIAPACLGSDVASATLLFAHPGVEWRAAAGLDVDDPVRLAQAVDLLRRWHASPVLGHTARTSELADTVAPALGARLDQFTDNWSGLRQWISHIDASLTAIGADAVPMHREIFLSNILVGPGASLLVDFDHAADGDAYADVGALALAVCELDADYPELVELYAGAARRDLVARTRLHAIVEDFRWGSWSLLRHARTVTPPVADFLAYGRYRLSRCAAHIAHWDAAALIVEAGR